MDKEIRRDDGLGGEMLSQDDFFLSEEDLKHRINQDLGCLLNTVALEVISELEAFPRVRRSVLNYGVPDMTGRFIEDFQGYQLRAIEFQDRLRDAIREFEPRLKSETVKVNVRPASVNSDGQIDAGRPIEFEIIGEIWASPVSVVMVDTVMDLHLGQSVVDVVIRSGDEG